MTEPKRGPPLSSVQKKRKTLEAAQKYAQKGAYDKALKEYAKLLTADPRDTNVRLKIGDLHLKKGDRAKAIEAYSQVAQQFSKGGFDAKAVAIYKQILRVDNDCLDARVQLGDHFQRMGLASDALREFQLAVKYCQEHDLKREAFDQLKKVALLDPGNIPNRLNLAGLMLRQGLKEDAHAEFGQLLKEVARHTGAEMATRVAEATLDAFPNHKEALETLAEVKISTGDPKRAIELLTRALPSFDDDIEFREVLVNAYEAAGDEDGVRTVYREIAEIYKNRGDPERAREILQRHVGTAPLLESDETTSPSILLTQVDQDLTEGDESLFLDRDADVAVGEGAPIDAALGESFRSTKPIINPADLLAEAKVSLEFGDAEEAERLARHVIEVEPTNREAQSLLERIASGATAAPTPAPASRPPAAPSTPVALDSDAFDAEAFDSDAFEPDAIDLGEPDVVEPVAPPAPAPEEKTKPRPAGVAGRKAPAPARAEDESLETLPDIELVLDDAEDRDDAYASIDPPSGLTRRPVTEQTEIEIDIELDDDDSEPQAQEEPRPGQAGESRVFGAEDWNAESARITEDLEEAEFFIEQGMMPEAERLLREVLARIPNHPKALLRLGEILNERGEELSCDTARELFGDTLVESQTPTGDLPSIPEIELGSRPRSKTGAVPPARTTLHDVPQESLDDLRADAEEAIAAVQPAPEDDFDLAAMLDDEPEDDPPTGDRTAAGFDAVFAAFKKGIQDQVGEEESETHYDLAIAYKEMGLLEDAVRELEIVQRAGARQIETLSLMAACKLELGEPAEAASHLKEALSLAGEAGESAVSLRYDLGEALLAAGERSEALEAFKRVAAKQATFRDVADRIAELS